MQGINRLHRGEIALETQLIKMENQKIIRKEEILKQLWQFNPLT